MDEGRPPDPATEDDDSIALEPRPPSRTMVAIAVVVIVALAAFAILGGRVLGAPAAEPTAPPELRLAVTDDMGRLYTMDADGEAVTEHASPGVQFALPAWSPDGTRIAVTGEGDDGVRLYLFDAEGDTATEPTVLYEDLEHPPFYLYWSPDGRQIGFLTSQPDGIALRLVPANGSGP